MSFISVCWFGTHASLSHRVVGVLRMRHGLPDGAGTARRSGVPVW
ncbi:hypothetical protein [Musicola paradisiaca]|nr:hypothetical protein [Musicola paradisiaca]